MIRLLPERHILTLQIFLIMTICMPVLTCEAQTCIEKPSNLFRDGDVIMKQQILCKDIGQAGTDVIWNIMETLVADKVYRQKYMSVSGSDTHMASIENATIYSYELRNDTLFTCGFENNTTKISYRLQEPHLIFPMKYGDSHSGFFHGTGIYCDRIALRSFGRYEISADAYGKLVLPEGDTLKDVIRLHTERFLSSVRYPADSLPAISSAPFPEDSIRKHLGEEPYIMKSDIYRWYAKGCRYPVLESFITTLPGNEDKQRTASFYYPASLQQQLAYDAENDNTTSGNSNKDKTAVPSDRFMYSACRTGKTSVRLEYTLPGQSQVCYSIYTTDGKAVYRSVPYRQNSGKHQEEIDLSDYTDGIYILEIHIGDERYTEKIILRR